MKFYDAMPKVTALIISYNHAGYITDCLASIMAQQVEDLEVICVDDGSTDGTPQRARSFDGMSVTVYEKPNGGPSDAFNFGIERAEGDILCMISADDIMLPGSIRTRVDILENRDIDIVCGLPNWIGADGATLSTSMHPDIFAPFDLCPEALFRKLFFEGNFICAPTIAMRQSSYRDIGAFDTRLVQLQDYEYWLRAAALGKRFHCTDRPLVGYRWHGENLSLSNSKRSDQEFEQIRKDIFHFTDQAFLKKVLNGNQSDLFYSELLTNEISALLMMLHSDSKTSNIGFDQLQSLIIDKKIPARLRDALLL